MISLEREEIQALRLEEQRLPEQILAIRKLVRALLAASQAGEDLRITIVDTVRGVDSGWLTTEEVARMFRVTERTVRRWCEEGKLEALQTPGATRGVWRISPKQFSATPAEVATFLGTTDQINQGFGAEPIVDYER